jgi:pantetheine-phosphate adenylyltransferase
MRLEPPTVAGERGGRTTESEEQPVRQGGQQRPGGPRGAGTKAGAGAQANPGHRHVVAVYPGSFDPVHRGHIDIAKRAARLVDELVVAVYATPSKNLMFPIEERVALWREAIAEEGLANVRVQPFEGLIVDFARTVGAQATVRGLRAVTDFEYEFQQALMNRNLAPEIETLMIITALPHLFISSSLLKEVARLGGDLNGIVTPSVARAIQRRLGK